MKLGVVLPDERGDRLSRVPLGLMYDTARRDDLRASTKWLEAQNAAWRRINGENMLRPVVRPDILLYDAGQDTRAYQKGMLGTLWRPLTALLRWFPPLWSLGLTRGLAPQRPRDDALERHLRTLMARYRTDNLAALSPDDFEKYIRDQIDRVDYVIEGYSSEDLGRQRDLSIKFSWGHNHDFGTFALRGRMGDRHVSVMRNFLLLFGKRIEDFSGKDVLDVGCWTGGTTLLLAALGARVRAIEEVRKYALMTRFLTESFGLGVRVDAMSLYELEEREAYDIIHFPGVVYHLSDPVVALRLLFNALRLGGTILVESGGVNVSGSVCAYEGCVVYHRIVNESQSQLNRGGWNWFLPSPTALARMLWAAGFDDIRVAWADGRVYAEATKARQIGITRAGLSRPDLP